MGGVVILEITTATLFEIKVFIFDQAHLKTKIKIDDDFNLKIKLKLKAPFQKPRTNQETLFINLNLVITTPFILYIKLYNKT